jgi:hypothetical protein
MDLFDLLEHPEGKTLESTRDLPSPDRASKTIVPSPTLLAARC